MSQAAGVSPLEPALGATLGASMGFMMPVSTPPNAIVYSSGFIPITAMMSYGLLLDVVGFFVIVGLVLLGPLGLLNHAGDLRQFVFVVFEPSCQFLHARLPRRRRAFCARIAVSSRR